MFCQYCGKRLEDGQLCDCPESQNDFLNELDAEDVTMMNQEYPENQENPNHKSLTKSMVKTLFQEVSDYVRAYLKSPPQAIAQAVEICNIKIAVVLSILTAVSTGLAIFGIFDNLRSSFIDVAKGVITRYSGSLLNVDELITLKIFDFLWWGALIAIFYIFVYCILYYFMTKVLIHDISLKGVYIGCSTRKSILQKGMKRVKIESMGKQKIVEYFEEVETRREYNGYFCSIPEAISIVVLGSICGLRNISQIHQWAESDSVSGFLKEKFGIEHIPCYYWLLSLLKLIKPESLNKCLMKWAETMLPEDRKGLTVSLDGKTVRSTCKMESYDSPLHIISAQISELGITFASKSVEGKSNEIPAVQQLIGELDIRDCLVTADALNCQRETAEVIVRGKGDYLLDAKGNQPVLEEEIREYVQDESLRKTMDCTSTTKKAGIVWKCGLHIPQRI